MTNECRQKVNYVKGELNNYYHLMDKRHEQQLKAEGIRAKIDKVSGGSPALIPSGESEHDPHWRSPLFEQLEYVCEKIDSYTFRIKEIDFFMARLQPKDREIIHNLHISRNDKKTYSDYCFEVHMSRKTLQRYVARLILDKWKR